MEEPEYLIIEASKAVWYLDRSYKHCLEWMDLGQYTDHYSAFESEVRKNVQFQNWILSYPYYSKTLKMQ